MKIHDKKKKKDTSYCTTRNYVDNNLYSDMTCIRIW